MNSIINTILIGTLSLFGTAGHSFQDEGRKIDCSGVHDISQAMAGKMKHIYRGSSSGSIISLAGKVTGQEFPDSQVILVGEKELQTVIDNAPPHSIVICSRKRELTLTVPIFISKPLTIRGMNARLEVRVGRTPLVVVESEGVTITDFVLRGNAGTVDPYEDLYAMMMIRAGQFRVENGKLHNGTKDGLRIYSGEDHIYFGETHPCNIGGGVVRNITGFNIAREVVSIEGGEGSFPIEYLLVENIYSYGGSERGAVEVSDGTSYITVRKVYAENAKYAVDIQDHKMSGQVNHNILIEDVYAKNCELGIRFGMRNPGHHDITVRDVTTKNCKLPLKVKNADMVTISNIRVVGSEEEYPLTITGCNGVVLRDIFMKDVNLKDYVILVENCNNVLIDCIICQGPIRKMEGIAKYRISENKIFSGLRISGILVPGLQEQDVVFENVVNSGRFNTKTIIRK